MTRRPQLLTATALAVLLIAAGPLQRAAHAGQIEKKCYPESDDADHDGFASTTANESLESVDESKKLYCPEGFVSEAHDCYPDLASAHPYAPEIAFNGINDDCSSGVDEPELVYFPNGNQNTKTSFSIRVRLASSYLVGFGSRLAYQVEFQDLAASSSAFTRTTAMRSVGVLPSDYAFDAPVTGLQPGRVYRAKLHFYEANTTTVLVKGTPSRRTTYTDLSRWSEYYFSATQGSGLLEEARTDLLLDGFYQLSESDRGRIGYMGTAKRDGTRFGAAAKERWCSEFYTWLASSQFWQIGIYTNTGGIMWWFMSNASYYPGASAIPEHADRADYIPHDSSDAGHEADHSTMFLAYDPVRNRVWTLEGNAGNHVEVKEDTLGTGQLGVGHLTANQLILMNLF